VILDEQVLKDLVDGVVVTNEPEPMAKVEPEDDLEELPEDAATKLDLVAILLEMGDVDSARESLRQVIADGDAEQVKRAQQILATID
jgi:FimV-like protein